MIALPCLGSEPPASTQGDAMDDYAMFFKLSRTAATEKAKEMAATDFQTGRFRVLVYGLRAENNPSDTYLKKHFGVEMTPIAGCIVSDGILGAADGYNSTMKPLLNQKFGKDIFKEAESPSRR